MIRALQQEESKSTAMCPMGFNMESEQKRKLDALEQKIRPQIPLYIIAMDMTSVSFGFLVSYKFIPCSQEICLLLFLFFLLDTVKVEEEKAVVSSTGKST